MKPRIFWTGVQWMCWSQRCVENPPGMLPRAHVHRTVGCGATPSEAWREWRARLQ